MRVRMRRRSTSSLVSPGPRVPMPPPRRDIALPRPASRGSWYWSCASSTCTCASRPLAFCAKMSRITWVRSSTLRLVALSSSRVWAGVSSRSNTSRSAFSWYASETSSSSLPRPTSVLASTEPRRCRLRAATVPPALRTSSSSSSTRAFVSISPSPVSTPTTTARSSEPRRTSRARQERDSSSSRAAMRWSASSRSTVRTSAGGSISQSSSSEVGGATIATCVAARTTSPRSLVATSTATIMSRRFRKSAVRSGPDRPPGLRCTCTSRRPRRRASASPAVGGSGVSAASPAATVVTRPRRSISTDTGRPMSSASSPIARASSAVTACSGGTRRR